MQTTLKEQAKAYEPKQTLNIADLDRVSLDFPLETRNGTDSEGKEYSYHVLVVNGQEYRVPNPVLEKIQEILELRPNTKFVKVEKKGTGKATRYSVKLVE